MGDLDHGILNTPIGSRARGGSIDAQIDRYKAEQAKAERRARKAAFRNTEQQKARVRELLSKIGGYRLMQIARPLGCRTGKSARKAIYSATLSNLPRWITALEREKFTGGCAACWAPLGKCDHSPDEWMGPE